MAGARRDDHGRVCCGTTLWQDLGWAVLMVPLYGLVLLSLLFFPPSKRVGSPTSWT